MTEPELHTKLIDFIDHIVDRMLDCGAVEPGLLPLIAGAQTAMDALDRRQRLKEPA